MAGYLRGALKGLGKGLSEIGTNQIQSDILEARAKRLAKYEHELTAPEREATAARLATKDAAEADYRKQMVSLSKEEQQYKIFKDSVDRVSEATQALDEWYAEQTPIGGQVSPEVTKQYNDRRLSLREEYGKIMRSFPSFAKQFTRDPVIPPPNPTSGGDVTQSSTGGQSTATQPPEIPLKPSSVPLPQNDRNVSPEQRNQRYQQAVSDSEKPDEPNLGRLGYNFTQQ